MIVKFFRHAKRRAKLYRIPEAMVETILTGLHLNDGEHEIIKNISDFKYQKRLLSQLKAML